MTMKMKITYLAPILLFFGLIIGTSVVADIDTDAVKDLLREIIQCAKQAKQDGLLKGYEMANITRPATHALRDLRIYEQRLKQGREEAAQDRYESYQENLDKIDEALDKIAVRPGREEFVAKIRALLNEVRNPSPSPSPSITPTPITTPSLSPSPTPTPSPSITPTPSPTPSPSPTPTPTNNCSSYVNDSQPIVADDFNSYSDGSIVGQGSWQSYVNGSNFVIQGAVVNEGAKALHNSSFSDSVVGKQGSTVTNGKQAVCFRTENRNNWGFYSADGNVGFRISKGLNASGAPGLSFASVSLKQDGNVAYYDQVADVYSNFAAYNDNEWTLLEVEWRSSDKTARYRLNSGTWTDWKPFANSASFTGFDYVNLGFVLPSGSGGVYFDTLK